ncbi:hypothetical protein FACS1894159_00520 [Bacteroidia bacterium]|nr:hypothetical protein FACS1894159_00520 [Bacteroidia bacterium]
MAATVFAEDKEYVGGGGFDGEPTKTDRGQLLDLQQVARERMKAKRVITASTIASTPLPEGGKVAWSIGKKDNSSDDLALGPNRYREFLANDFGFEDKNFVIGVDDPRTRFPYVLPGPADFWGGTWPTSGWHTHQLNILFSVDKLAEGDWRLRINVLRYAKPFLPLVKVSINGQDYKLQMSAPGYDVRKQKKPLYDQPTVDSLGLMGKTPATPYTIEVPVNGGVIREGNNTVVIYVLEGSWITFDNVDMISPAGTVIAVPKGAHVGDVTAADYELQIDGGRCQPLLVQAEQLVGTPELTVELDGKRIFKAKVERDSYTFEAPMPAVSAKTTSDYRILVGGKAIRAGKVERAPQPLQQPASYVDTRIGGAHSRWMIAPGPWMPFSMVKMSPDNQNGGWQSGYQPTFESLGAMSHVHCWSLAGVGMLPVNGPLKTVVGDQWDSDSGYRSRIDKRSEQAPIGLYKVHLTDYDVDLEATTTSRCAFQRYTFPKDRGNGRVMIDMRVQAEFDYEIRDYEIRKVGDRAIEGFSHQFSHDIYCDDSDQEYVIHFFIEFDRPIVDYGGWNESKRQKGGVIRGEGKLREAGAWVEFDVRRANVVQARSGISYVSNKNARLNLESEITRPFGWSFDAVHKAHVDTWNETLSRVNITTANRDEKIKFYNSLYRSIASRSTYSDINGEWVSADTRLRQLPDAEDDRAMGCDAFWNSFWNLNQVWNLITPEWSKRWVGSHLAMYDANGWMTNGPGAMKYIRVMVAEHEIPQMVSAWQMGITGLDTDKMLEAMKWMENAAPRRYAHGFVGNRDMVPFLKYHYVPWDEGTFSNTMEYSFDNWCVGQLAKAVGDTTDYRIYNDRGYWWRNVVNPANKFAHMRNAKGEWFKDFDPFASGAHTEYVEGNAWQLTFFVPQDVPALADVIGKKEFVDRLQWGFEASEPWRYNAPNDQYWDFPVVQGNQQSMHFSYLFNWAGKPWLTQRWTRSIADRFYGIGAANAYLGDEDQGQMSGWLVMSGIGLFQTDGGARCNPIYEIGSPLYDKVEIDLGGRYGRGQKFTVIAKNNSRLNMYVQKATLNGRPLDSFAFPASEVLNGGELILEMGPKPNEKWGLKQPKL